MDDDNLEPEPSGSDGRGDLATVHSVDRALLIVDLLTRDGVAMTAREIALATGINRTTAHRLLNSLIQRGWIERANGSGYQVSLRHLVLANLAYQRRDVFTSMRPAMEQLSNLSRETVHIGVLDGFNLVHVDKIDSPERVGVSSKVGTRVLPHLTSLGKAILAVSPAEVVASYIDHVGTLRNLDVPFDPTCLQCDLDQTRQRGYSVDDEEDSLGVRCIGSAIIAGNGDPVFAMSITGPSGRFTMERAEACAPSLVEATLGLSRSLGWEGDRSSAVNADPLP